MQDMSSFTKHHFEPVLSQSLQYDPYSIGMSSSTHSHFVEPSFRGTITGVMALHVAWLSFGRGTAVYGPK